MFVMHVENVYARRDDYNIVYNGYLSHKLYKQYIDIALTSII